MKRQKLTRRLFAEQLETREVPATFGVPWPDPQHLTVSFAPDNTSANGSPSALFQTLNAQAPTTAAWQTEILRALQTWAVQANINIGIVSDGGQAIGISGSLQGDTRFGDIRVAAIPEGPSVLAITSPVDSLAGTRSGDMLLNSGANLTISGGPLQYDLYSVALHEAGHALSLGDSLDMNSAMFSAYQGVRTGLSQGDIDNLRALYGARLADQYEGTAGNGTIATATKMKDPAVQADITTNGDVDVYEYKMPGYAGSTVTVRVQTAGVSLLTPKLTVYDANGNLVTSAITTDPLAGGVSVQLSNVSNNAKFYFKVEGSQSGVFGIGAYRLKVDSGQISQVLIAALDQVFSRSSLSIPDLDHGSNDTIATAKNLNQTGYQADPRFTNAITGSIETPTDIDFYRVTTPTFTDGQTQTLVVSVAAVGGSTLDPAIQVYNATGQLVAADVLVNDSSSYMLQIPGVASGNTFYIKVAPDMSAGANNTGDYLLGVNYRSTPIALGQIVTSTLTASQPAEYRTMSVSQSQVTHLVLSASATAVPAAVRLTLYDQNGVAVFVLTAMAGQTVSGDVYLAGGVTYKAVFCAATADHSPLPSLTYNLRGKSLTDPIDPLPTDPTDPSSGDGTPVVTDPTTPPPSPDPLTDPYTPPPPGIGV
jgi:hypothetical protein